jgi:hypothetical protein
MEYSRTRRLATAGAVAALSLTGLGLSAAAASASAPANIDQYDSAYCQDSDWAICLWYHTGGAGAGWGGNPQPSSNDIINLTNQTFFITDNGGSAGVGDLVRNDAASAGNGTDNCIVAIWYSPNATGYEDYLEPNYGGDLITHVVNNEASVYLIGC